MRHSWTQPGTWLGLLGSLLVLVGASAAPWQAPHVRTRGWGWFAAVGQPAGQLLLGAGVALLCVAFFLLAPRRAPGPSSAWVAALWYVPLLVAPPVLSRDVYAYLDQGWLTAGGNPYETPMGVVSPFAGLVDDFWRGTTAVYPPLALELQRGVVALGGGDVVTTVLLMRLPVLGSVALVAWLAPRLAARVPGGLHDADRVRWLFLLNPLTVVHLVGGAHNDAVMIALVVLACWLATTRGGYVTGAVVAGLAACTKQPGLLAAVLVALIALPPRALGRRVAAAAGAVAIALAAFAVATAATGLGYGWTRSDASPAKAYTQSPGSLLRSTVKSFSPIKDPQLYGLVIAVFAVALVAVLAWLWLTRWRHPLEVGAWGYLAYAALGPGLQPWYLLYAVVFLAMIPCSHRAWVALCAWVASLLFAPWVSETVGTTSLPSFALSLPVASLAAWLVHRDRRGSEPAARV